MRRAAESLADATQEPPASLTLLYALSRYSEARGPVCSSKDARSNPFSTRDGDVGNWSSVLAA